MDLILSGLLEPIKKTQIRQIFHVKVILKDWMNILALIEYTNLSYFPIQDSDDWMKEVSEIRIKKRL